MRVLMDRVSESFVRNQFLGPLVIVVMAASAFVAGWFVPKSYLPRLESIALTWAAIMMLWAAWGSRGVAITSRDQIKEMRRQRQDSLMPVIEIRVHKKDSLGTSQPQSLDCSLDNIGPGPALDVGVHLYRPNGNHQFHDAGTIAGGQHLTRATLAVTERDNTLGVSVCYRDVFGRDCESRREIARDTTAGQCTIGPLKVHCK